MAQYLLQGYSSKGPFYGALYADEDGFHAFGIYEKWYAKDGRKLGDRVDDFTSGKKPLWLLDLKPADAGYPINEYQHDVESTALATLQGLKYGPPASEES